MGMDIHMALVKDKKYIAENIFDGRNSTWFNNMMGDGEDDVYDSLPSHYGYSEQTPEEYKNDYTMEWCFGFNYINVKDFKDWYLNHRPDEDAGWVTTYEKWTYETKGIKPNYLKCSLTKDDIIEDMHFITVVNKYDCSAWLYAYLVAHDIPDDADITYCFDH